MVFKCKICGGELNVQKEQNIVECEYCGVKQTLPKLNNEQNVNLYDRANHFRRNNEYDKAMSIYEQILNQDNTDAEAYWSLVLCRYGVEYVEDSISHKRVPTVNRTQNASVYDDSNYKAALKYADESQKVIYESEANIINEIQKEILKISQNEDPFDIFICYKETDNNGRRTQDSVLANELYHGLTNEGFKVFFSRITLEDKLGTAYEPYIFAALNSAKVMIVIGTKPEYFNAIWVKNEWSRYLALIKNGAKKTLIPAYRDMDPYDLPEEFSHLQAQDISKLGFMQDLIRGIKKITDVDKSANTLKETIIINGANSNLDSLLKRANMALEDGDWNKADIFFEQALNQNPECVDGYLGKLMLDLKVSTIDDFKKCKESFESNDNYKKTIKFCDTALKEKLEECIQHIEERNEKDKLEQENSLKEKKLAVKQKMKKIIKIAIPIVAAVILIVVGVNIKPLIKYNKAINLMDTAGYDDAIELFKELDGYMNSEEYIKESKYGKALALLESRNYNEAYSVLGEIKGYSNTNELIDNFDFKPNQKITKYEFLVGQPRHTTDYIYDAKGNCLKEITTYSDGRQQTTEYQYDNSNCVKMLAPYNLEGDLDITEYEYDAYGKCIKKTYTVSGGGPYIIEYKYDENERCIEEIEKFDNGIIMSTTTLEYDGNNNCSKRINSFYPNGPTDTEEFQYDSKGNCIKKTIDEDVTEYEYNSYNDCIKEVEYNSWGYDITEYEYNGYTLYYCETK